MLQLGAAPERAVAATKSYTASLLAVAMLVAAIEPDRSLPVGGTGSQRRAALEAIPGGHRRDTGHRSGGGGGCPGAP